MEVAQELEKSHPLGQRGGMITFSAAEIRRSMDTHVATSVIADALCGGARIAGVRFAVSDFMPGTGIVTTWASVGMDSYHFSGARLYHSGDKSNAGDDELTILYDENSKRLVAIAIGAGLGDLRNGALGVIAAQQCCRVPEGGALLGVVGAGRQAWAQLEFLTQHVRISDALLYCRKYESFKTICRRFSSLGRETKLRYASSAYEAVKDAHIVVTATSSPDPVVEVGWLRPDAHVNYIGSKRGGKREIRDLSSFDVALIEDRDQLIRDIESHFFSYNIDVDAMVGLGIGRNDDFDRLKKCRSVFFSNCYPGGEISLLAWYYLRSLSARNGDTHGD